MFITLENLELRPARLEAARDEIRRNAYFKWQAAGCPSEDPLRFWREAELEWIEFEYVPERSFEEPSDASCSETQTQFLGKGEHQAGGFSPLKRSFASTAPSPTQASIMNPRVRKMWIMA